MIRYFCRGRISPINGTRGALRALATERRGGVSHFTNSSPRPPQTVSKDGRVDHGTVAVTTAPHTEHTMNRFLARATAALALSVPDSFHRLRQRRVRRQRLGSRRAAGLDDPGPCLRRPLHSGREHSLERAMGEPLTQEGPATSSAHGTACTWSFAGDLSIPGSLTITTWQGAEFFSDALGHPSPASVTRPGLTRPSAPSCSRAARTSSRSRRCRRPTSAPPGTSQSWPRTRSDRRSAPTSTARDPPAGSRAVARVTAASRVPHGIDIPPPRSSIRFQAPLRTRHRALARPGEYRGAHSMFALHNARKTIAASLAATAIAGGLTLAGSVSPPPPPSQPPRSSRPATSCSRPSGLCSPAAESTSSTRSPGSVAAQPRSGSTTEPTMWRPRRTVTSSSATKTAGFARSTPPPAPRPPSSSRSSKWGRHQRSGGRADGKPIGLINEETGQSLVRFEGQNALTVLARTDFWARADSSPSSTTAGCWSPLGQPCCGSTRPPASRSR